MNVRTVCVAVTVAVLGGPACASLPVQNAPLNKGTIELWRDASNTCHTNTTPFFRVKKGRERKVEWKINDPSGCTAAQEVEVKFDKGDTDPLPSCTKRNRRKIECDLRENTPAGTAKYSVWLGSEQEDPVLEIEQF